MKSRFKISIGALMVWIILVALQFELFQGAWNIVVIPSATMAVLSINIGIFFLLVRPPALETRIIGMLLATVVAFLTITWYFSQSNFVRWGRPIARMPPGRIGMLAAEALDKWRSNPPNRSGLTATAVRFIAIHMTVIEFAALDLISAALISAGGWLENRLRRRPARPESPALTSPPPLDDRAASPL